MAFKAGDIVFELSGDIKGLNDAMGAASKSVQKNFGDISGFVGKAMVVSIDKATALRDAAGIKG